MSDVPAQYQDLPRWAFGDNPALADELLALVLAGKKTATCGALWQYEDEGWAMGYVYDMAEDSSDLVVLDAKAPTREPVARIHMPRRVPHGFHGSWIRSE